MCLLERVRKFWIPNLTRLLADILYGIILQKRHPVQESTISQMAIMPTSH